MSVFRQNKAFTLIEMLIVAALIAIFAGLAMINIQQQFKSNLKKTVIGESKHLATAYSFIVQDIGIYPKPSFAVRHLEEIKLDLQGSAGSSGGFDYIGNAVSSAVMNRILQRWNGPYFAMSQTRTTLAQGIKGVCKVRFQIAGQDFVFPAPSDPYTNRFRKNAGNPYVLYLLKVKKDSEGNAVIRPTQPGEPAQVMYEFLTEPTDKPDIVAVVSYGPNGVPGGPDPLPPEEVDNRKALRLFRESDDTDAHYDLRIPFWYRDDPDGSKAMAYFDYINAPGSDDIVMPF